MLVRKGEYLIIDEKEDEPPIKELPKVKDEDLGAERHQEITGKQIKATRSDFDTDKQSIINKKPINWKQALNRAMSGAKLSAKAKRMLVDLSSNKSLINWKEELKKFFDKAFTGISTVFPKRRFISQKTYLYGQTRKGVETLKTVVIAIDTSGSISHDQGKTFLIETAKLSEMFTVDRTIIMYCSDKLHSPIQDLKKNEKPDLTLWPTTGGNACGFIPPFAWLEKNKIVPSVMIYMTDTGGEMPDPNSHKIKSYKDRVFWFVVSPNLYNRPPFGKVVYMPVAGLKSHS